jgi:hypothetical protein
MTMLDELARVSLIPGAMAGPCQLCARQASVPTVTVVVQHPRGGVVQLGACDWCVQALRRLSAASGGAAAFAISEAAGAPPHAVRAAPYAPPPAGPPVLVMQLSEPFVDARGTEFLVRVLGHARSDGTWAGWLEFAALDSTVVLRTNRETTQSSRDGLAYWASGLEPAYILGAFERAQAISRRR